MFKLLQLIKSGEVYDLLCFYTNSSVEELLVKKRLCSGSLWGGVADKGAGWRAGGGGVEVEK